MSRLICLRSQVKSFVFTALKGFVVVQKDAFGGALGVVKLARSEGPEEGSKADQPHAQSDRNEEKKSCHDFPPERILNAFRVTMMDEPDIASAAMNGVTSPASAIGTAIQL